MCAAEVECDLTSQASDSLLRDTASITARRCFTTLTRPAIQGDVALASNYN